MDNSPVKLLDKVRQRIRWKGYSIRYVKRLHQDDLARGYGRVYLPNALAKKYPNADDLHPRSQSRGKRGEKPAGFFSIS